MRRLRGQKIKFSQKIGWEKFFKKLFFGEHLNNVIIYNLNFRNDFFRKNRFFIKVFSKLKIFLIFQKKKFSHSLFRGKIQILVFTWEHFQFEFYCDLNIEFENRILRSHRGHKIIFFLLRNVSKFILKKNK